MSDYQLTSTDFIMRVSDGASIPNDPDNRDRVEYDAWVSAGNTPDPYVSPVEPQSVLSQDLMAQFDADDAAKIRAAVEGNSQFWLLWSSLQAQKDAMIVGNARFMTGWNALVQVLGADRMAAISTALGVTIG